MEFSDNIKNIKRSGTFEIFNLIKQKTEAGEDIISLCAGELYQSTPIEAATGGIDAIKSGKTKYTLNSGILELREAICAKFLKDNHLTYFPEEIMVSCGAKHSIFNAVYVTCGEGDEVIIFTPYYSSYPDIVKLAGATPKFINLKAEDDYQIDYDLLKKNITDKTKMIIINSPNNPSGAVLNENSFEAVSKICIENNIWLLSDEIYEKVIYTPNKHLSPAQVVPEVHSKTIIVNGFSKTYAMTGWRIGYMAACKELIDKVDILQSHMTSNASSISQYAALRALQAGDEFPNELLPELEKNRAFLVETLSHVKNLRVYEPQGAFYLLLSIQHFWGKRYGEYQINSSYDMAIYLLNEMKVGIVPGSAFGADNSIRLSFSPPLMTVKSGLSRIIDGFNQLK